jgi:hypothetical protein
MLSTRTLIIKWEYVRTVNYVGLEEEVMVSQDDWNFNGTYNGQTDDQLRNNLIRKAREWIQEQGYKVLDIGIPKDGQYFVNYPIRDDGWLSNFFDSPRKVLRAEYTQLYGTTVIETNFNKNCRYYIVAKL